MTLSEIEKRLRVNILRSENTVQKLRSLNIIYSFLFRKYLILYFDLINAIRIESGEIIQAIYLLDRKISLFEKSAKTYSNYEWYWLDSVVNALKNPSGIILNYPDLQRVNIGGNLQSIYSDILGSVFNINNRISAYNRLVNSLFQYRFNPLQRFILFLCSMPDDIPENILI